MNTRMNIDWLELDALYYIKYSWNTTGDTVLHVTDGIWVYVSDRERVLYTSTVLSSICATYRRIELGA